ncbi:hypothetical protein H6B11_15200 [Mediterraneibacter glycyrrhizinilyticus]|nr:hypothetical protein [Mediterraneibacter glycyrrhizinilyticus]MBM6855478.1 hypothetical protein [Mediterraneibacter glycyrrhizinilyticus]
MDESIYLNELSLDGQYDSMEEFFQAARPFMKCLKLISEKNCQIQKHSMLYSRKITKDKTLNDLRGMRGDHVTRLKSLLLSVTDAPPFWDWKEEFAQDLTAEYICENEDVSATSLPEAAEDKGVLLSFPHKKYQDRVLRIVKNGQDIFSLPAAATVSFMAKCLLDRDVVEFNEYLAARYAGTRLNFSMLEPEFGFDDFEKEEVDDCLRAFDKFVSIHTWDEIYQDQGLRYKKYSPGSDAYDWFRRAKYRGLSIDKFRCGNPKRCFGFRKGDVFYVLRMERDHKISDHG